MLGAAAVSDGGVVVPGHSYGTWAGIPSRGSHDFAAVKLDAAGNVIWRWKVKKLIQKRITSFWILSIDGM